MAAELIKKRDRIYTFIVVVGFISTNAFIYLEDPSVIIEFLSIELILTIIVVLGEGFSFWRAERSRQKRDSFAGNSWPFFFIFASLSFLRIIGSTGFFLFLLFFGIWVTVFTVALGIVIARQIYSLRQPSDNTDFEKPKEGQTDS